MKRLFLFTLIVAFVIASTAVYAAEKAPLGIGNIAVKLDYLNFTEDDLGDLNVDDAFYVGLEGYGEIIPNLYLGALYLGAEVGYANPDGKVDVFSPWGIVTVDSELTYVPIELNLKYVLKAAPNLVIDLGAGVSYNYAKAEISALGIRVVDQDDWLFGGQFFADLNYTVVDRFFIGINAKYQITEDFDAYIQS